MYEGLSEVVLRQGDYGRVGNPRIKTKDLLSFARKAIAEKVLWPNTAVLDDGYIWNVSHSIPIEKHQSINPKESS